MNTNLDTIIARYMIKYNELLTDFDQEALSQDKKIELLLNALPERWKTAYWEMTERETSLIQFDYNGFTYYFDQYSYNESAGRVPRTDFIEDRVLAVIGKSVPALPRDGKVGRWLRGLIGGTEKRWGPQFDKGHFIAHSIGGGLQINIFPQRRDMNRGYSKAGKLFRKMEDYCFLHPNTLCFHRPIYVDESARPVALDFGLLKEDGSLWVETFDNRETPLDGKLFINRIPKGKNPNTWWPEQTN